MGKWSVYFEHHRESPHHKTVTAVCDLFSIDENESLEEARLEESSTKIINAFRLLRGQKPKEFERDLKSQDEPLRTTPKQALDLGAGTGRDAVFLTQHGFRVTALDRQSEAKEYIEKMFSRTGLAAPKFQRAQFKNMVLGEQFDLVNASLSLPFTQPKDFKDVWFNIVQHIKYNGRFSGHFFGNMHGWSGNAKMTFFTIGGCINLFRGHFTIEFFFEEKLARQTVSDGEKYWHEFDVVAKRKPEAPEPLLYSIKPVRKILQVEYQGSHAYAVYNQVLGVGSYGQVLLAEDIDNHEELAVKVQPYSEPGDIEHEIRQSTFLDEYKGSAVVNENRQRMHYMFVTLAKGICVERLYFDNVERELDDILDIIRSSFYALKYVYDKGVVHNDVHEANLVYNPKDRRSRLVDAAFSVRLKANTEAYTIKLDKDKPVPRYKAPESNTERSYATDIYQLGFMALRLLLIMQEKDQKLKSELIKSRELCFDIIQKNKSNLCLETLGPLSKLYKLLYGMMDPERIKRPRIDVAIDEFESCYKTGPGRSF